MAQDVWHNFAAGVTGSLGPCNQEIENETEHKPRSPRVERAINIAYFLEMDTCQPELKQCLSEFDGKAVSILGETETRFCGHPRFLDDLIGLLDNPTPNVASGASWILKSRLEAGCDLSALQTHALVKQLSSVCEWQAKLHLCQSIRYLKPEPLDAKFLVAWSHNLLDEDRPFLRAWSLDAVCHISNLYPDYRDLASVACQSALEDPAASVRARVRKLAELFNT